MESTSNQILDPSKADLFFDFLSPFAYLHWKKLEQLSLTSEFNFKPIILGRIFKHWGQKYILEIPQKRDYMFKACLRFAKRNNIKLLAPKIHPFNTLYTLRMVVSNNFEDSQHQAEVIGKIWDMIWQNQIDPGNPDEIEQYLGTEGTNLLEKSFSKESKDELKNNLKEAIENKIFGVPTILKNDEMFWGNDSLQDFIDYENGTDPLDYELFNSLKTITAHN